MGVANTSRRSWTALLAAAALVLWCAAPAAAQHSVELEAAMSNARWEGRMGYTVDPTDPRPLDAPVVHKLTGGIGAYARLRALTSALDADDAFLLDVDLGWRFWAGEFFLGSGEVVCCRLLNPYVGASAGWESEDMRVRGGVGMTLPVANAFRNDGRPEQLLWEHADAAFGYRDGWLTMGETMAFVVRGDWEARVAWLRVGVEAALALMVPVLREGDPIFVPREGGDPFTRYQLFFSASGVIEPWVEMGLRVGVAGWAGMSQSSPTTVGLTRASGGPSAAGPPGTRFDDAQISASPFARVRFAPGYVEARATLLLDDPNGLWSETTHLSVALAGGVELE